MNKACLTRKLPYFMRFSIKKPHEKEREFKGMLLNLIGSGNMLMNHANTTVDGATKRTNLLEVGTSHK